MNNDHMFVKQQYFVQNDMDGCINVVLFLVELLLLFVLAILRAYYRGWLPILLV